MNKNYDIAEFRYYSNGISIEVCITWADACGKSEKKEMEGAWKLMMPLRVDIGMGRNWAEAH